MCASALDLPVLCQGEERLRALVREFAADERDLPVRDAVAVAGRRRAGAGLPARRHRPHPVPAARRPAVSARAQAVSDARRQRLHVGVGPHAALRLAQGAGGWCAPLATAAWSPCSTRGWRPPRYGEFLRASLPPFWLTTDRETALGALRRLHAASQRPSAEQGATREG